MKALKGLLIYIGIVLAMILGIAILLFAGMYFFPTFRILGVGVVHGNREASEKVVLSAYSDYDIVELNVNSKNIDIRVEAEDMETPTIEGSLGVSVFGLAYDITEYGVVLQDAEVVDRTLRVTFNVTEPNGLISYTGSNMIVKVPTNLLLNLNASSTRGDMKIGGRDIKLNNLNISNSSGNAYIANGAGDTSLDLESLTINTKSGDFYFDTIKNVKVKNVIKINGTKANVKFNNLEGSISLVGEGIKLEATSIKTGLYGLECFCDNGVLKIGKLETPVGVENAVVTENGSVEITELIGETGIISKYASISINKLYNNTMLKSDHGNISINEAFDDVNITTEYGNITVNDYKKNGIFTSKRGLIKVKNTGEYEDKVYTKIVSEDGDIDVDNNINKLIVETTGKARAAIVFRQIKGEILDPLKVFEHKVNIGSSGSAIIFLPAINYKTPYKFKAYGNISGEISGFTPEYEGNTVKSSEDYQYYPKASEEYKEKCQQSCYFSFYGTINIRGYQNQ